MIAFFVMLLAASLTDLKYRYIPDAFLFFSAIFGTARCIFIGRGVKEILVSSAVGVFLLLLNRVTCSAIGEGDGCFFVISGLFISPGENVLLFVSGIFLCCMFSLIYAVISFVRGRNVLKVRIPFLPFLLPGGMWLAFFAG